MKLKLFLFSVSFMLFAFCGFSQIKVISNGNVGVNNTAPAYKLDVNGTVRFITGSYAGINTGILLGTIYTDGVLDPLYDNRGIIGYNYKWSRANINNIWTAVPVTVSDEKVKENISPVTGALATIMRLNGIKYDLKDEYFAAGDEKLAGKTGNDPILKNRIGFVAQEMAQVLPNLVVYDSLKQVHGIVYENLIPVLVEAIKEQQKKIDELNSIVVNCCSNSLKGASLSTAINEANNENIPTLDQNIPNPFSNETRIGCFIPATADKADLFIYTLNGVQLQQNVISGKGKQTVIISGYSFEPGMYLYTLVIDDKEVDTKKNDFDKIN